jgi:lysophospholipase L1-like esterase
MFQHGIRLAVAVTAMFVSLETSAAVALNLEQAFAPAKAILAAGGQANILVMGDSLSYQSQSWVPVYRDLMQATYGDAGAGYQGFSRWSGGGFNAGWTEARINQDLAPHHSLDGLWAATSETNRTARLDAWGQTIELHYVVEPGGGRLQIEDAGRNPIAIVDTDAAQQGLGTWSYTFPEGQNRIWFRTLDNAPVTILGQNNITEDAGVRIHRAANGGWGVNNFIQRDWTFDAQLVDISPDLIYVWLGQNDQNYSQAGYEARLHLLVDRLEQTVPDAQVVLVGTKQGGSSAATIVRLARLVSAMGAVAEQRGLGFIDLFHIAGDHAFYTAHDMLTDGIHFSQAGGDHIGQLMFEAFLTDGASLQAGVVGDYNGDGLVNTSDINPFIAALTGAELPPLYGDMNADGKIDTADINPFITALIASAQPGIIPEPTTAAWLVAAALTAMRRRSRAT